MPHTTSGSTLHHQRRGTGRAPKGSRLARKSPHETTRWSRFPSLAVLAAGWTLLAGLPAFAEALDAEEERFCRGQWQGWKTSVLEQSDASIDLYNGVFWLGGWAGVHFGANPKTRWTDRNEFDDGIRDGLRIGSTSGRKDAETASDVLAGVSAGLSPLIAMGKTLFQDRDCDEAFDMLTDAVEATALTFFLTEATKIVAGRERPYVVECDGSPPSDADCTSSDRKKSFFSGHSSLAAVGAGLSCSYAIKRQTWGQSTSAQAVPCALAGC